MMYYLGVMQWILKNCQYRVFALTFSQSDPSTSIPSAWFFFKLLDVSGAEAVVAASSPWIGQGESACLVRPYVDRT